VIEPGGVVQRVRPGAYAWLESSGRALLVRISPGTPGAGLWTLPGGGLRFGEDPETGVRREVLEETGLEIAVGALLGARSHVIEPHETASGHRIHTVGLLYRATISGGELRNEADGSTDIAAWIPFEELTDLPSVRLLTWARGIVGR